MQAAYSTDEIAPIMGAHWIQTGTPAKVRILLTDSRSFNQPEGVLFFAINGLHHDGHDYIEDLYQKGVRNFVISKNIDQQAYPEANIYHSEEVVRCLQRIAAHHRSSFNIPVIGITGSNGKTIVKEWLFQLLHEDYHLCRSPKSYNSQIGVPLSVWRLNGEHDLAVFEAGISQTAEMEHLQPIIRPTIGIFTHLGEAHSQGFDSQSQKLEEKLKLFSEVESLIYCKDHLEVEQAILAKQWPGVSWGTSSGADFQILKKEVRSESTLLRCQWREEAELELRIPFKDKASVENALHCCTLMKLLGLPDIIIQQRVLQLEPVAMRLETMTGINNCILINDSYNADITGLQAALAFMHQQYPRRKRTAILSGLLQSSEATSILYDIIARMLQEYEISRVIGVGAEIRQLQHLLPGSIAFQWFADTKAFLSQQDHEHFKSEVILIKGARNFGFEQIARRLSAKVHQTQLEVNINALIHNIRTFQRYLKKDTKMMLMVKAAAYGTGSLEVARALAYHQASYLAVAYADEGIELREGGIHLPIMVLNPEEAVFDSMLRYQLEPEIYSLRLLNAFGNFTLEAGHPVGIHLKLDTGMHRLGFEATALEAVMDLLESFPQLHVKTAFTHLAASDDPELDNFTRKQIRQFEQMYSQLVQRLGYRPERHVLNSGGILRFPEYQMEMVRLGIGAYGVDETGIAQASLRAVLKLTARISQIKELPAGATVGYGRAGKIVSPSRIATVSIGYADGLSRRAGNGKFQFLIKGETAPVVGRVCMDMCMVDISHIPEAEEGDEVVVFGEEWPVSHLARALDTISYEVFASISPRVRRVYVQE
jgi:alanine racemase